jgi:hypothetical protein
MLTHVSYFQTGKNAGKLGPASAALGNQMPTNNSATIAEKLKHELRDYALLSVYLYVCFGSLILYKIAILGAQGVSYLPFGLPILKALILAKFILVGRVARLGERHESSKMVFRIMYKALAYLVLLIVLSAAEEVIVGMAHGRSIAAAFAELGGDKLPELLATCLIMLLILIPYLTITELDAALGNGRLREILFKDRTRRDQA